MALQLVKKWGNSPAVRLPAAVMEAAQLSLEQAVEVRAENGRIVIEPAAPTYNLDELLAGITVGHDSTGFTVDNPNARGACACGASFAPHKTKGN